MRISRQQLGRTRRRLLLQEIQPVIIVLHRLLVMITILQCVGVVVLWNYMPCLFAAVTPVKCEGNYRNLTLYTIEYFPAGPIKLNSVAPSEAGLRLIPWHHTIYQPSMPVVNQLKQCNTSLIIRRQAATRTNIITPHPLDKPWSSLVSAMRWCLTCTRPLQWQIQIYMVVAYLHMRMVYIYTRSHK